MRKTSAPWNQRQLKNLYARQADSSLHKYTCKICSNELEPITYGWTCKEHGLVQRWAYLEDLNYE